MKVAFFTEMGFNGKIPRTHKNMRTEFAWMVAATPVKLLPSPKYVPKDAVEANEAL